MKNGRGIRGIIFDMDDTLIDWSNFSGSWRDIETPLIRRVLAFIESCNAQIQGSEAEFLQAYGENVQTAWLQARSTLRTPHMGRVLMQTLKDFGVEENEAITMKSCLQAVQWRGVESVRCFPDVPDALQQLTEAGYVLGILTNAFQPMWMRDAELERYNLLQYFPDDEKRMSAADIGHLKPHPQVFRYALQQMGTPADKTVYVGDNPVADIAGAQGMGLRAVLRVNKPVPPLISGLIVPDATINSLAELPPILEQWHLPDT
jgi:HAD superfamily hydrolase (TIGR01549 family)